MEIKLLIRKIRVEMKHIPQITYSEPRKFKVELTLRVNHVNFYSCIIDRVRKA